MSAEKTDTESPAPVRLVIRAEPDALELIGAELFAVGAGGLVEEPGIVVVYPTDITQRHIFERALRELATHLAFRVSVESIEQDWQNAWKAHLRPERVSPTFVMRPTHCPLEESDRREQTIWFHPDTCFGSGEHPTTRLAATFIERWISEHPDATCFDVGTGSGVLALVAAKSGAARTLAVDVDEIAVRSARENVVLNHCEWQIEVAQGSADMTLDAFELVAANIISSVLLQIGDDLRARVASSGVLVLSGLLSTEIDDIVRAFATDGFEVHAQETEGEWGMLVFARAELE